MAPSRQALDVVDGAVSPFILRNECALRTGRARSALDVAAIEGRCSASTHRTAVAAQRSTTRRRKRGRPFCEHILIDLATPPTRPRVLGNAPLDARSKDARAFFRCCGAATVYTRRRVCSASWVRAYQDMRTSPSSTGAAVLSSSSAHSPLHLPLVRLAAGVQPKYFRRTERVLCGTRAGQMMMMTPPVLEGVFRAIVVSSASALSLGEHLPT